MNATIDIRGVKLGEGIPKLIVPVAAKELSQILSGAHAALSAGAEIVEWRADFFDGVTNPKALRAALAALRDVLGETPLLFTLRSSAQGGALSLSPSEAADLLLFAAESGEPDLVDVEYALSPTLAHETIASIQALQKTAVCSLHLYDGMPPADALFSLLEELQKTGARILKLAVAQSEPDDQAKLFDATLRMHQEHPVCLLITMALGKAGMLSRILAETAGSVAVFGAAQQKTDPGQLSAKSTKETLSIFHKTLDDALEAGLSLPTPKTKLLAFLGTPLKQALSPRLLNALFAQNGLHYFYLPIDTAPDELDAVLTSLRVSNLRGFAVTKPHKTAVLPYLDELDVTASRSGACNTVVNSGGKWVGYNTDGIAAVEALKWEGRVRTQDETFLCIGAGGTARAMCFELALRGAKRVYIFTRSDACEALATEFNRSFPGMFAAFRASEENYLRIAQRCGVILNLSGSGMFPHVEETPLPKEAFRPGQVCFDAVYNPSPTRFLHEAREAGCRIINGLGMLQYTVAKQLELWRHD